MSTATAPDLNKTFSIISPLRSDRAAVPVSAHTPLLLGQTVCHRTHVARDQAPARDAVCHARMSCPMVGR
jgi:hypothetical protein